MYNITVGGSRGRESVDDGASLVLGGPGQRAVQNGLREDQAVASIDLGLRGGGVTSYETVSIYTYIHLYTYMWTEQKTLYICMYMYVCMYVSIYLSISGCEAKG